MKHLKLFEGFQTESEVSRIFAECNVDISVDSWSINSEGLVDVIGDVDISRRGLNEIPLKFGKVSGDFKCGSNNLTSLKGCPHTVSGSFDCKNNSLTNLKGGPRIVNGRYNCKYNKLTSLEGCANSIRVFDCSDNNLRILKGLTNISDFIYYTNNPCTPIYRDWINNLNRRNELVEMLEDYDFLRGNVIIWERLKSFFEDANLEISLFLKGILQDEYEVIE